MNFSDLKRGSLVQTNASLSDGQPGKFFYSLYDVCGCTNTLRFEDLSTGKDVKVSMFKKGLMDRIIEIN